MNKFQNISDAELLAEVLLRKKKAQEEREKIPSPLDDMDWIPLTNYVITSVKEMAKGEGEPKDFEHWIFETVMETIYGDKIWEWWNKH